MSSITTLHYSSQKNQNKRRCYKEVWLYSTYHYFPMFPSFCSSSLVFPDMTKFRCQSMYSAFNVWIFNVLCFICLLEQYLLYGPFFAKVMYSRYQEDSIWATWCLHVLILCSLRGLIYQLWSSFSNMLFLTRNRRIIKDGVDFKQIDKEWDWYILVSW